MNSKISCITSILLFFYLHARCRQGIHVIYVQQLPLKEKLKPTSKHWYAQVLVQYSDDKKITLTLFEEPIKQILAIQNKAFTNNN